MILAVVKVLIPETLGLEEYTRNASKVAPNFRDVPGLIRKNFLYSAEERVAGGVYFWESREAAEACYRPGGLWRENFTRAFGAEPDIVFFECPCVVDNVLGEILTAA